MSYIPKYCCQCSEKIERTIWRPWTSRRFCELCATNFGIYDNAQNIALVVLTVISIIGIGNMFRKPEKELSVVSNQLAANFRNTNRQLPANTNYTAAADKNTAQNLTTLKESNSSEQTNQSTAAVNLKETVRPVERPVENQPAKLVETVYFCGAQTKKGTPCTRRVRNGGRCWQHPGQTAMLPQQKLLVSQ